MNSHIKIEPASKENLIYINKIDSTFKADSKLILSLSGDKFCYTIVQIPSYLKSYDYGSKDFSVYITNKDKIIFFAFRNEKLAGQIILFKSWNNYCYIYDLRVAADLRRKGIGYLLIEKAITWAKENNCIGLEAETQDINVKACLFYEKLGFTLGGYDKLRYKSSLKEKDEIALNWYLLF